MTETTTPVSGQGTLADFIDRLTADDLARLREAIRLQRQRLAGLCELERVVATALGETPPAKKKGRPAAEGAPAAAAAEADAPKTVADVPKAAPPPLPALELLDKRRRVARFLRAHAYANGQKIVREAGIQPAQLAAIMNDGLWFRQDSTRGWFLTEVGKRDAPM